MDPRHRRRYHRSDRTGPEPESSARRLTDSEFLPGRWPPPAPRGPHAPDDAPVDATRPARDRPPRRPSPVSRLYEIRGRSGRGPITDQQRLPLPARRFLCRYDDHTVFAYARGHDLLRRSDHALWAHLSGDVLLSARSGKPFAYAQGSVLYDVSTNSPVYYFVDT